MDLALLVKLLTLVGLIAIMLSMGLKVTWEEVMASARRIRLVVLALVANFVLVPAVAIGLLYVFAPNPIVSVGFLLLAVCPGAPVGPPFAALARGDVPCAIGLMVILAGASAVLSPALLRVGPAWALAGFVGGLVGRRGKRLRLPPGFAMLLWPW